MDTDRQIRRLNKMIWKTCATIEKMEEQLEDAEGERLQAGIEGAVMVYKNRGFSLSGGKHTRKLGDLLGSHLDVRAIKYELEALRAKEADLRGQLAEAEESERRAKAEGSERRAKAEDM